MTPFDELAAQLSHFQLDFCFLNRYERFVAGQLRNGFHS